jgi:hypothetical protein
MLDDELLLGFTQGFLGYGSTSPRIVFLGMEEGGGNTYEEVAARLRTWSALGKPQIADLRNYHRAIDRYECFSEDEGYRRQPTWQSLSKIYGKAAGIDITDLNAFQRERWCLPDGDVALIELFPLPSPTIGHWHYCDWTAIPQIGACRATYYEWIFPARARLILKFLRHAKPTVVVAYGLGHRRWFEKLLQISFVALQPPKRGILQSPKPSSPPCLLIKHPTYASNRLLSFAGRYIAQQL